MGAAWARHGRSMLCVNQPLGLFWREEVTAFRIVQRKSATDVGLFCTFVNIKIRDLLMSAHVKSASFSPSMLAHPTALQCLVEPRPLTMTAANCSALRGHLPVTAPEQSGSVYWFTLLPFQPGSLDLSTASELSFHGSFGNAVQMESLYKSSSS